MDLRTALLGCLFSIVGCGGRTHVTDGQLSTPDGAVEVDATAADALTADVSYQDGTEPDTQWPEAGLDASVKPDSPLGCQAQQAHAEGVCTAIVPGFRWTGNHCVPLGSGCGCAGADCAAVYETLEACVAARWGCYPSPCEPQAVASNTCLDCDTETFEGAAFNGRQCKALIGCGCAGAGCASLYPSVEECESVTSVCDGVRCLATGGQWFPAAAGFCGFRCGAAGPIDCESPFAACLCAPGQTFVAGAGCQGDPSCGNAESCTATGGIWHPMSECYCGFTCGQPGGCDACVDSCDCGPLRNFSGPAGCVLDNACGPYDAATLCKSTGGQWKDCSQSFPCSCGDYTCGIPNTLDPCVAPGCDCGWLANFDAKLGCRLEQDCTLRGPGSPCTGQGVSSGACAPGLACCGHCGAYPGCSTCDPPCCPESSSCWDGCYPPPP